MPPEATLAPAATTAAPAGDILNCNFEVDLCSMIKLDSGDFDWQYEHLEDDFEMPPGGHILVDATGHNPWERAIISTPDFTAQGLQCASFWYRFIGSESGVLRVNYKVSPSWVDVLWQRSDSTIPAWTSAMINMDVTEASYALEWEVEVSGQDSIIVVGNIIVSSGGCPVQAQTCDYEYENGVDKYCGGYQSSKPSGFQFFRTATITPHEYAEEDHTYKSMYGYYIVADFSKTSGAAQTRMYGPQVQPDSTCCSFWFILDIHHPNTEGYTQ